MSVIRPQSIYVGQNTARPDFKGMTRDIQTRMAQIDMQRQQQRQFEIQRQDQLNREFLKTVDVDRINLNNAKLQQKSADLYKNFQDSINGLVESKQGNLTTQDIMNGRAMAAAFEQEMAKYQTWDNNRKTDVATYMNPSNTGKFDKEVFEKDVLYYDGSTPYNESRLKIAPTDLPTFAQKVSDALDPISTKSPYGYFNDEETVKTTGTFNPRFWEYDVSGDQPVPKTDANGMPIPNYKEQGNALKSLMSTSDFVQDREGVVKRFNQLSAKQQEDWDEMAKGYGLTTTLDGKVQGDGEILYALHPEGENVSSRFGMDMKRSPLKASSTASKSFSINFGGKKITDNLTNSTSVEYGDVELDNFYPVGEVKVKLGKSQPIKGARVEQEDGTLGNAEDIKVNNAEVVGVNMKDGFVESVVYSVPSTKWVYKVGAGVNSMSAETLEELAFMMDSKVNDIKSFAKKVKTTGEPQTIVAPAYGNESTFQKSFAIDGSVGKTRKHQEKANKTIKASDIAVKAKASGYSIDEYRRLLKENGVEIIE